MQIKDMKSGDIGIINFGNGKEIVMRSWADWPDDETYFYILFSKHHKAGDAYDRPTYENYKHQELIKQLTLNFDPKIIE